MAEPDYDGKDSDTDGSDTESMFDFLAEDAANRPARPEKVRRSERAMPIIRPPVPVSESVGLTFTPNQISRVPSAEPEPPLDPADLFDQAADTEYRAAPAAASQPRGTHQFAPEQPQEPWPDNSPNVEPQHRLHQHRTPPTRARSAPSEFDFLTDASEELARGVQEFDTDGVGGHVLHDDDYREYSPRRWPFYLAAFLALVSLGSGGYLVFQDRFASPVIDTPLAVETPVAVDSVSDNVAAAAVGNDSTAPVEDDIALSSTSSLGDRFRAEIAAIETLVADGNLADAELALNSMDRAVYGYGVQEFTELQTRIDGLRDGSIAPANEAERLAVEVSDAPRTDNVGNLGGDSASAAAAPDVEQSTAAAQLELALAAERAAAAEAAAREAEAAEAARQAELDREAEAARLAELERQAEAARLAQLERDAEAARQAEEAALAAEQARQAELEQQALAARQAALEQQAEAARLAELEAAQARAAEENQQIAANDATAATAGDAAAPEENALSRIEAARQAQRAREAELARRTEASRLADLERNADAARRGEAAFKARAAAREAARLASDTAAQGSLTGNSVGSAAATVAGAGVAAASSPAAATVAGADIAVAPATEPVSSASPAVNAAAAAVAPPPVEGVEPAAAVDGDSQNQLAIASPLSITDDDLRLVYKRFLNLEIAIESKDINTVIALTQPSGRRIQQFLQVFENSDAIDAKIGNVAVRNADASILGRLNIQRLVRADGTVITDPQNLSSIALTSVRGPDGWSLIDW